MTFLLREFNCTILSTAPSVVYFPRRKGEGIYSIFKGVHLSFAQTAAGPILSFFFFPHQNILSDLNPQTNTLILNICCEIIHVRLSFCQRWQADIFFYLLQFFH